MKTTNANQPGERSHGVTRGHMGSARAGTAGQTVSDTAGNSVTAPETQFIGAEVSGEDGDTGFVTITGTGQQVTNSSGADLDYGDVVVQQADGSVTTTTTAQDTSPIGVVQVGGANGLPVSVVFAGYVAQMNTTASVTAGNYAETSPVAGQATQNATPRAGSFGRFLATSANPPAILFGQTYLSGGGSGGGGGVPSWYNVQDYGALEDNTTNCQSSVNAAITALNAAGGGVLYFPGNTGAGYLSTGAFDAITVPAIVTGDGLAATVINCSSATAYLFTTSTATRAPSFRDMSIINTHATPTAGSGIRVLAGNYGHYARLRMENWWVGIRHEDGAAWGADAVTMNSIRKYGFHISNAATPDEGDWFMANCAIVASTHSPDAAIYIESSGGGKIFNCKINGSAVATGYNHGIQVAIAGTDSTSILLIENCSIENIRGDALHVTQVGTAYYALISMLGCQVSLPSNNSGKAVSIVAEDASGIEYVIVTGNIFVTDGTARTAIALTKVNVADVAGNMITGNFTSVPPYTQSASTVVTSYYPGAQLDYVQITAAVNVTATTEGTATTIVTANAVTFDGVGSYVITFYSPAVSTPSAASQDGVRIWLYEDGSSIGRLALESTTAAAVSTKSVFLQRHLTPTAGSHTYSIRAHVNSTTGTPAVNAGAGGTGNYMPAFIKITKA